VAAAELDRMTWPEVRAEQERGRDTVVLALGATEQHGPHMPLATDALLGDHLARAVADRLEAFLAPTVRIGCSQHHLEFPGTLSLSESTFRAVVADIMRSLARGGFRRAVLLPTHGGNFAPLAAALDELGAVEGLEIARSPIWVCCSRSPSSAWRSTLSRSARAASTPASGRPRC
jgi:creatinine amidohydrolase